MSSRRLLVLVVSISTLFTLYEQAMVPCRLQSSISGPD
jgi:hypothetical protein